MKIKKLILTIIFSILTLSNQQSNIHAEKEIEEGFHETNPQIRRSSIGYDESSWQENVENYLQTKYGTQNWHKGKHNTTETVSNGIPIEMQSNIFTRDRLNNAMVAANKNTTYPGCGAIAMIGVADFFARYLGYTEISTNPNDIILQEKIAEEILKNVHSWDVTDANNQTQTIAMPWSCASGFNKVMKLHNLENTIQATHMGFWGISKEQKVAKIKEQVDIGLPVTIYTLGAGSGYLGNHYVNVYGYEDWHGIDQNGNSITHTMLQFRMNWRNDLDKPLYMDSNILDSFVTGVIYYEITYQYQCLPDMLFMGFKNENNQGQYFNEEVEKSLSISGTNISLMTRRLRCSYLDQ